MVMVVTADMGMVTVAMAITVMAGTAIEVTTTVTAATMVIPPIGTTITGIMATIMVTVAGGAGVGMVMELEPAGLGRHTATDGFAIKRAVHLFIKRPQDEPPGAVFLGVGLLSTV